MARRMSGAIAVGQSIFHELPLELGQVVLDGAAQLHLALLHQHHDGDAGEVLCHGHDLEDGIGGHGFAAFDVAPAHGFEQGHLPVAGHQSHRAGYFLAIHQFLEAGANELEPVGIEPRRFRDGGKRGGCQRDGEKAVKGTHDPFQCSASQAETQEHTVSEVR